MAQAAKAHQRLKMGDVYTIEQNTGSITHFRTLNLIVKFSLRFIRSNIGRMIWAAMIAAVGLGTYLYVSAPAKVQVTTVQAVETQETLSASGRVRGEKSVDLGLDISGIVRQVNVKNGDEVRAGQVLLMLDKSELIAGADAARAAVASAQAELMRASRSPLRSEVAKARAEVEHARSVGDARVVGAQARLRNLRSGARSQEIAEARAELQRLKALLNKAESDLKRTSSLVKQGALAASSLDDAQTSVDTARASANAQEQRISMLKAGSRPAEVAEAEAALSEAIAARSTSVKSASEGLNTILSNPRREDINAAKAKLDEAKAEYRRAIDLISKCELRAPFSGVVADLPVEQGQSISPGQKLVVFEQISRPVIEVETDEANLKVLRMYQKAVISSDAYPGRTFNAYLYDLGSKVDADRGTIKIKLRPEGSVEWLRTDLTVDVNIITAPKAKRLVIPADSVTRHEGKSVVFVIDNDKATPVEVTTGAVGPNGVAVNGALREGMHVARNAAGVEAGDVAVIQ